MDQSYEKQNPAFYVVIAMLVMMSIGPVILMFVNSFKLDVDIISATCFGTSLSISISARLNSAARL